MIRTTLKSHLKPSFRTWSEFALNLLAYFIALILPSFCLLTTTARRTVCHCCFFGTCFSDRLLYHKRSSSDTAIRCCVAQTSSLAWDFPRRTRQLPGKLLQNYSFLYISVLYLFRPDGLSASSRLPLSAATMPCEMFSLLLPIELLLCGAITFSKNIVTTVTPVSSLLKEKSNVGSTSRSPLSHFGVAVLLTRQSWWQRNPFLNEMLLWPIHPFWRW